MSNFSLVAFYGKSNMTPGLPIHKNQHFWIWMVKLGDGLAVFFFFHKKQNKINPHPPSLIRCLTNFAQYQFYGITERATEF